MTQARVNVPDDRFRWLCSLYKPKSEVPAFLEIVDIAGLVRRANSLCLELVHIAAAVHVCPLNRQPACSWVLQEAAQQASLCC